MKKPVVLRIFKGDQLLGVKQLTDAQVVLGRPGDVQVELDGERVSLIHAAIEERDTGYFLCDLGSETGTFKNGEAVLDAPIESGDIIQIGEFRIEFFIGVPKPKSAPGQTNPSIDITSLMTPQAPSVQAPVAPKQAVAPTQTVSPAKPTTVTPPLMAPATPSEAMTSFAVGGAAVGMAGPRTGQAKSGRRTPVPKSKRKKTFAPPSKFTDVRDFVKPSKGTVVEVLVAWRERIIETHHFSEKKTVTLGSSPSCDIVLPVLASRVRKTPLLQIDTAAKVLVTPDMTGELIRGQTSSSFVELLRQNKMAKEGASYGIMLEQGEMIRIDLSDQISLIIRYTSDSPKPLVAPILDLTAAEFTGVVLAAVLIAILRLYTFLYTPPVLLPGDEPEEPVRIAIVATPTPIPAIPPPQPKEVSTPAPTPPAPVVKATPQPKPTQVKEVQKKTPPKTVTNLTKLQDPGASAKAAPNPDKSKTKVGSVKKGGAIKTTQNQGSQMNSKPDKNKEAAFSAFGGGGAQDKLSKSQTGAGELAGLANAANGKSGFDTNRAGVGLGAVKDTGAGDNGKALENGIKGGLVTSGRGSGKSGYGNGGLGAKAGTKIITGGGAGEQFPGTIDREAIRRVLKANERTVRSCYERQLNKNPDLIGKLVLTWDITDGGRAVNVRVASNELGNQDVANCMMDHLKQWKFPDPPANQTVEVSYPWVFSN